MKPWACACWVGLLCACSSEKPEALNVGSAAQGLTNTSLTIAVISINFRNNLEKPFAVDEARALYFEGPNSVAAYYQEASYGVVTMTGEAFDWVTVDYDDASCDLGWYDDADAKLEARGIDLSAYQYKSYLIPGQKCWGPITGASNLSGPDSHIALFTAANITHELGHNLGAEHARALNCPDIPLGRFCTHVEYGDPFDPMGSTSVRNHMNAFHKGQLGWLEASNTITADSKGTFTIAPLEQATTEPMVLRVPVPNSAPPLFYYVEYRQPFGFDDFAPTDSVVSGVLIHRAPDYSVQSPSDLISMNFSGKFADPPLRAGQTFSDGQVSIKLLRHDASSATLEVGNQPRQPDPAYGSFLIARCSNLCSSVSGQSTDDGAIVQQLACDGFSYQRFRFTEAGNGEYEIANVNSNKCLDTNTPPGSKKVTQQTCNGSAGQRFRVTAEVNASGASAYHLVEASSGDCVYIKDASTSPLVQLRLEACDGSTSQSFEITDPPALSPDLPDAGSPVDDGGSLEADATAPDGSTTDANGGSGGDAGGDGGEPGSIDAATTADGGTSFVAAEVAGNGTVAASPRGNDGCGCRVARRTEPNASVLSFALLVASASFARRRVRRQARR